METPAGRLSSLDAFRGFTIAAMVLVNNPGDWNNLYSRLAHARWHGWTFADALFPWLLLAGLLFVWLGVVLDAILMPINKSLWTPSYCFLMTGWALLIFSAFFWLLDVNPDGAVREAAACRTRP